MKKILFSIALMIVSLGLNAQKYSAKNGYVGFYSHTPVEDIKADNNQVASVLDSETGDVVFQILNKSFHFERALMEEHFNENYMESENYPKSTFRGKITDISSVKFSVPGVYNVNVEGEMNMHGVAKKFTAKGTLEVLGEGLVAKSEFVIIAEDYGIDIPGIVREKIAKEIQVRVNIKYLEIKK